MASAAQARNKKSRCFIINQDFPNQDADDPYPLRQEHSRKFITLIQTERRKGYGFVPFIGAGFSAPSGAPLVKELETYLRRCIYMALCRDEPEMPRFQWHPRTDQWPPLADHSGKPSSPDHWWQELLAELSKGLKILSQSERDAFQALRVQGLGAGIDWRTALLFLARLKHGRRGTDEPASLEPPLQEIIDAGLRAVLKEKSPTLEQNMLAVLASELRLDLLLTTNFDDLLERSFAAARNPLQVFEVHLGDSLPHWSALSEVRALVKMHGNRHSLRADYSLDALPTEDEKRRFLEYLLSGQGRSAFATEPTYAPNRLDFQNHLLVMGCSGREKRTLGFIEYAWERLKKDFKVFWLCYGGSDVEQVRSFSNECLEKIESRLADEQNTNDSPTFSDDLLRNPEHHRSIILRHPYNGLLLLEMYQALRRNLPPYSAIFPSVSRIPVPPLPAKRRHEQHLSFATQLQYQLDRFRRNNVAPSEIKLVIASSANTVRGVTTECARVFSQMERSGHVCLWLDMNDISSANNLFEVLLEAAYYKLGIENWIPVYRERDEKRRPREIERLVRSVNKDWVVFLNARETPGANSIDNLDVLSNEGQHGWLSFINPPPDETAEESITAGSFFALLQQLCHRQTTSLVPSRVSAAPGTSAVPSRISVVLMCREPLPVALVNEFEQARLQINRVQLSMGESIDFEEHKIVAAAILWTNEKREEQASRRKFLHSLVLMQRPRLLATIWSNAASVQDEQAEIASRKQDWLDRLEECGLIRRKPGGFIWVHLRCRNYIREILQGINTLPSGTEYDAARAVLMMWNPAHHEPKLHRQLAKWYAKVVDASESPSAVFEALYHFYKSADRLIALDNTAEGAREATQAIESASALLRANSFLIQTQGYARGSCRKLAYIRSLCRSLERDSWDRPLSRAARRLRRACTETMRAIAREVGENTKAYLRHRQFAECYLEDLRAELKGDLKPGLSDRLSSELPSIVRGGHTNALAACALMRWYRWSGMLALASRLYSNAESAFERALAQKKAPAWFVEAVADESGPQELLLEKLRLQEQYIELLLQRYSLEERSSLLSAVPSGKQTLGPDDPLSKIENRIADATKLVYMILGRDHSSGSHYTISANCYLARLLTHKSTCISLRTALADQAIDGEGKLRPDATQLGNEAMGLLANAEVALRISDSRRFRAELGTIELHRAETRLHAADAVEIGKSRFRDVCALLRTADLSHAHWPTSQVCSPFFQYDHKVQPQVADGLRRAKSLVIDGLRFLERAEPVLRERRRNVWWTTWFFEKRMRLIAMLVWSSLSEPEVPVPYFGLESAAFGTTTVPDQLLEEGIRMSGVDAYRLATIVDAYASSAKALYFRLKINRVMEAQLAFRLKDMTDQLKNAISDLEDIKKSWSTETAQAGQDVDSEVDSYITLVRDRANATYGELESF